MIETGQDRVWLNQALRAIEADVNRSADTHLFRAPLGGNARIALYIKDESTHPSGSLKHRLARSLFLYALCNGWIGPSTTIVEASSGSTAVSEAYFARMLRLPFIAVMPRSTSPEKVAEIEFYGGSTHFVDHPAQMHDESARLAAQCGGHYMDQFTFAERATDWRGNNNIAESIFNQMAMEEHPIPNWIVVGAGTGGTSATLGRYIRYRCLPTRLGLADPEHSVFHLHVADRSIRAATCAPSVIEGVGRPRCEPSFLPGLIDCAVSVPDAGSIAAARVLSRRIGRSCGGSTGTNLWAVAEIASRMVTRGEVGSIVTLLCDSGERYRSTLLDGKWLADQDIDTRTSEARMEHFFASGTLN